MNAESEINLNLIMALETVYFMLKQGDTKEALLYLEEVLNNEPKG